MALFATVFAILKERISTVPRSLNIKVYHQGEKVDDPNK
jgi:hypothetical protein